MPKVNFSNEKNDPIFIAGHKGLVGSAVNRDLKKIKFSNLITKEKKLNLDLRNQCSKTF